jgi:hypothetical protein
MIPPRDASRTPRQFPVLTVSANRQDFFQPLAESERQRRDMRQLTPARLVP